MARLSGPARKKLQVTSVSWGNCDAPEAARPGRPWFVDNGGAGPYLKIGPAGPAVCKARLGAGSLIFLHRAARGRGLRGTVVPVGGTAAAPASAMSYARP